MATEYLTKKGIIKKYPRITSRDKLRHVGRKNFLDGRILRDFVNFFENRFPQHCRGSYLDEIYAGEWARRFFHGTEWSFANFDTRKILLEINPYKYRTREGIESMEELYME